MEKIWQIRDAAIRITKRSLARITNPFVLPEWLGEIRDRRVLKADALAGVTVALILIPQSMAYAQLAGLPPHYGLYAALLPPMVASFFGSSRQLATGPVAMVSLMTAAALEPLATAGSEAFIGYALLLALMVGLFQLALGMLRLGVLLNFLSHPVVQGFVNAAAIIIATSQLAKIFGVSVEAGDNHLEYVFNVIAAAMNETHGPTFAMAILALAIMIGVRRFYPRLPYVLIAVMVTTLLAWLLGFQQASTVKLEQISDQQIRVSLMRDSLQAKLIERHEEEFIEMQRTHAELYEGVTQESAELLNHRQLMEQTRFLLRELKAQQEIQHKALYGTPLFAVGEGEEMRLFTREEIGKIAGEESKVFGQNWHIVGYQSGDVELQAGGKVLGNIPSGLPGFQAPTFDWAAIKHLFGAMIAIALLGFMEAISIARAMAAKTRQHLDADRELIGQGIGNIVGSMFQAYPSSGSFSRSAVSFNAGALTGFAAVVTALVVAVTLLFLTPLLYYLPQATLAAVIMMAVAGLIHIKPMIHAWQTNRHDGIVGLVTFLLTLAFAPDLEMGILLGVLLSLALLLFRIMKPRVVFPPHPEYLFSPEAIEAGALDDPRIVRMRFDGALVFVNVSLFEEQLQTLLATKKDMEVLIIDGVSINDLDASGEAMLRENFLRFREAGINVIFTRLRTPIMDAFWRTHMVEDFGTECFHRKAKKAFGRAWELVNVPAETELADDEPDDLLEVRKTH